MLEPLPPDDHRALIACLDLCHFQDEAPAMVFWHPRGWTLYRLLEQAARDHIVSGGYREVRTPQLMRRPVWEHSGHWSAFHAAMFALGEGADLPAWLAPEQIAVVPVSPSQAARAAEVHRELLALGLRARLDDDDETLSRRVAIAHHDGIPFVIVVGAREVTDGTLAIRAPVRRWSASASDAFAELVNACQRPA